MIPGHVICYEEFNKKICYDSKYNSDYFNKRKYIEYNNIDYKNAKFYFILKQNNKEILEHYFLDIEQCLNYLDQQINNS